MVLFPLFYPLILLNYQITIKLLQCYNIYYDSNKNLDRDRIESRSWISQNLFCNFKDTTMQLSLPLEIKAHPDLVFPANGIYYKKCSLNSAVISFVLNSGVATFEVSKNDVINTLLNNFRQALSITEEDHSYFFFHDTLYTQEPGYFTLYYEESETTISLFDGVSSASKVFTQTELIKTIQFLEKIIAL